MKHIEYTAANGTPFTFVYIPAGEAGPNTHRHPADSTKATVEVYDARHKGSPAFDPMFGQFTGGSYRVDTFLQEAEGRGLALAGGVEAWTLDASTFRRAQLWVMDQHED